MVVVACSDTESVSMSVVIKRGFAALRYLKDGKLIMPEETIAIPAIIAPPKSARPLRNWALLTYPLDYYIRYQKSSTSNYEKHT